MKSLGKRLTMAVAATLLGIAVNIPSLSAAAGATHPTDLSLRLIRLSMWPTGELPDMHRSIRFPPRAVAGIIFCYFFKMSNLT